MTHGPWGVEHKEISSGFDTADGSDSDVDSVLDAALLPGSPESGFAFAEDVGINEPDQTLGQALGQFTVESNALLVPYFAAKKQTDDIPGGGPFDHLGNAAGIDTKEISLPSLPSLDDVGTSILTSKTVLLLLGIAAVFVLGDDFIRSTGGS